MVKEIWFDLLSQSIIDDQVNSKILGFKMMVDIDDLSYDLGVSM